MASHQFDSDGRCESKQTHMKKSITLFAFILLSFYAVVSFISMMPNPMEWGVGGRAAFTFFTLMTFITLEAYNQSK
jgi:hypothetical protein